MEKSISCETEVILEDFAQSIIENGLELKKTKSRINLRLDTDVIDWFKKKQGRGYQTYINALLKAFKEANENASTAA